MSIFNMAPNGVSVNPKTASEVQLGGGAQGAVWFGADLSVGAL